jgi:hypothetical protein
MLHARRTIDDELRDSESESAWWIARAMINITALDVGQTMSYETDAAIRYRAHAEELRTIAESEGLVQTRRTLIHIARDYERMAHQLETIDLGNRLASREAGCPDSRV